MRLFLFSFGKLKTPGLRDAADHYLSQIRSFVPIEEVELKPLSVPDKSPATRLEIQRREGELLLEKISARMGDRNPIILLDETGQSLPTQDWAARVRKWEGAGTPALGFCVGSSLGFSDEVRKRAQKPHLALGPQTLAHGLARVVLLEQIYRAWSVTRSHPYHNEGS